MSEEVMGYGAETPEDGTKKALGTGTYFALMFVFAIPVIGWIACLIMMFASKNKNLKHYATAAFIWATLGLACWVGAFLLVQSAFKAALRGISETTGMQFESISDVLDTLEQMKDLSNNFSGLDINPESMSDLQTFIQTQDPADLQKFLDSQDPEAIQSFLESDGLAKLGDMLNMPEIQDFLGAQNIEDLQQLLESQDLSQLQDFLESQDPEEIQKLLQSKDPEAIRQFLESQDPEELQKFLESDEFAELQKMLDSQENP